MVLRAGFEDDGELFAPVAIHRAGVAYRMPEPLCRETQYLVARV